MSVAAMERFTSLLAFVAGGGAVLIVLARIVGGAAGRRFLHAVHDIALVLAALVAGTAMAGSLWFSESAGFTPCKLCWYQRIAMFSLAVVLLVAAIRRDRGIRPYAVTLAGVGLLISSYHYLVEWHPQLEASDTCDVTVPCTVPWFREFGFVSLSFMALCGFAAILALLLVPTPQEEDPS
jgi:disulfide bond formation protein DsbB